VATYRGRITPGETHPGRGEGKRRGWRLIEVKYMAGNPSLTFTWRVWRDNEGRDEVLLYSEILFVTMVAFILTMTKACSMLQLDVCYKENMNTVSSQHARTIENSIFSFK